jgi:hypothetical protein
MENTVCIVVAQQHHDRCIEVGDCLFTYCITTTVVYRVTD